MLLEVQALLIHLVRRLVKYTVWPGGKRQKYNRLS